MIDQDERDTTLVELVQRDVKQMIDARGVVARQCANGVRAGCLGFDMADNGAKTHGSGSMANMSP